MKKITLNNPCTEQWDHMEPTQNGAFCHACAKEVVDFTKMDNIQMAAYLQSKKGTLCGRLRKSQLEVPLDVPIESSGFRWPKPPLAGPGIFMAAALLAPGPADAAHPTVPIEIAPVVPSLGAIQGKTTLDKEPLENDFKIFSGTVTFDGGKPIVHARVHFVTLDTVFSTFTDAAGNFSLPIPTYLIQDKNLFRVSLQERELEHPDEFLQELDDINRIVLREDLEQPVQIKTPPVFIFYTGEVQVLEVKNEPLVLYRRKAIAYQDFLKGLRNDPKGFDMAGKDFFFFANEEAELLLGKTVPNGLFLIFSQK